jgi:spore maturation protein CgeB
MQIAIFGLTLSSSWGNGHATIWRGLCRALGEGGHAVTFFEKDVPYYKAHRDLLAPSGYELKIYTDWAEIELEVRSVLDQSDCAIVTSYCPDARAVSALICNSSKHLNVFYDLDTPVTLNVLGTQGDVDYIPKGGLEPFDLVLSYTGGKALEELVRQLGARRVAPLYGCVDPSFHTRVPPNPHYKSDFSYLGTYAADRQCQLEEFFLKPAHDLPRKKFCIGGALYPDDFPWTENMYFVRHLPPDEHPSFYSSSTLTLNVTRSAMRAMGYAPSGRLFEAAACGTPIVSDWWEGLDQFFEPNREILVVRNAEEVTDALSLESRELENLASAARARALAEHTAERRASELIDLLETIA